MRNYTGRAGAALKHFFENTWHYTGSLAAVCLFAAVLGLGIYHAVVQDMPASSYRCYAGVVNPVGAEPPRGVLPLGQGDLRGAAHVRLEYGVNGRVERMRHLDALGHLSALPGSRVAEQQMEYDRYARLCRRVNKDSRGNPVEDAQGVAVREFDYDAAGRLVHTRFRDAAGRPVMPRFPGYAECRMTYDADGRPLRVEYLDAGGRPVLNAEGEQCVVYTYGADGSVIRENRVAGLPADNHAGVAREVLEPVLSGTRRSWQNAKGDAVTHPAVGAAQLQQEHLPPYGLQRQSYADSTGRAIAARRACAEHIRRSDRKGRLEWECFSGADGLPVDHPSLGYAERVCEYAQDGRLAREYFWDATGNPAAMCERRHAGDFWLTLHSDGSTEVQPVH